MVHTPPCSLLEAARIAMTECLGIKPEEDILIITNPSPQVRLIAEALRDAAAEQGTKPVLLVQEKKSQLEDADCEVLRALEAEPDIVMSISEEKLGKDPLRTAFPLVDDAGVSWDHIFHYLLWGKGCTRAFWSPGIDPETFTRTVNLDYPELRAKARILASVLEKAGSIRVQARDGTDLEFDVTGRKAHIDAGDYRKPGTGGNLPSGEVFMSPVPGTVRGRIGFKGSISLPAGELLLPEALFCEFPDGYASRLSGNPVADMLENALKSGEQAAFSSSGRDMELARLKAKNARHIGEFGIGLNPNAQIRGMMLEDEKVLGTCHFALGANYDGDGPACIHLDGLVPNPTIDLLLVNGSRTRLMEDGRILVD